MYLFHTGAISSVKFETKKNKIVLPENFVYSDY